MSQQVATKLAKLHSTYGVCPNELILNRYAHPTKIQRKIPRSTCPA